MIIPGYTEKNTDYDTHTISTKWSGSLLGIFRSKYDRDPLTAWTDSYISNPPKLVTKLNMLYPYFEKDIIDLKNKYIW